MFCFFSLTQLCCEAAGRAGVGAEGGAERGRRKPGEMEGSAGAGEQRGQAQEAGRGSLPFAPCPSQRAHLRNRRLSYGTANPATPFFPGLEGNVRFGET